MPNVNLGNAINNFDWLNLAKYVSATAINEETIGVTDGLGVMAGISAGVGLAQNRKVLLHPSKWSGTIWPNKAMFKQHLKNIENKGIYSGLKFNKRFSELEMLYKSVQSSNFKVLSNAEISALNPKEKIKYLNKLKEWNFNKPYRDMITDAYHKVKSGQSINLKKTMKDIETAKRVAISKIHDAKVKGAIQATTTLGKFARKVKNFTGSSKLSSAIKKVNTIPNMAKFLKIAKGNAIFACLEGGIEVFTKVIPAYKTGKKAGRKQLIKSSCRVAGSVGGFALGTAIGTAIFPGVGTVVGAVIGTVCGLVSSYFCTKASDKVGNWIAEKVIGEDEQQKADREAKNLAQNLAQKASQGDEEAQQILLQSSLAKLKQEGTNSLSARKAQVALGNIVKNYENDLPEVQSDSQNDASQQVTQDDVTDNSSVAIPPDDTQVADNSQTESTPTKNNYDNLFGSLTANSNTSSNQNAFNPIMYNGYSNPYLLQQNMALNNPMFTGYNAFNQYQTNSNYSPYLLQQNVALNDSNMFATNNTYNMFAAPPFANTNIVQNPYIMNNQFRYQA